MTNKIKSFDRAFEIDNEKNFTLKSEINDGYLWYLFDIENDGLSLYTGLDVGLFDLDPDHLLLIIEKECDLV